MSKLIDLYASMLRAAGLVSDENGFVSMNNMLYTGLPNEPAMIDNKRIVLPTDYHLRNPSQATIRFHPLREQAQRGESDTTARLRKAINIRLNFTFQALINELLILAKNTAQHKLLSPDQAQALVAAQGVTEATHVAFSEIITRAADDETKPAVSIYVKKSATIKERNYFRAGIVNFPMYNELKEEKPYGYGISEKERKNLIRLFEFVMPGIEVPNSYDQGSNSGVAPHMDALMRAFNGVAARLNDQIDLFKDVFKQPALYIDDDWVEVFNDLAALEPLIHNVPQQAGNEGANPTVTPQTPGTPAATAMANIARGAPGSSASSGNTVSITDIMNQQRAAAAVPAPVMYQPVVHAQPAFNPTVGYPGMPVMTPHGMIPQSVAAQYAQHNNMMHGHMPPANGPRGSWATPQPTMMGYGHPGNGGYAYVGGMPIPLTR